MTKRGCSLHYRVLTAQAYNTATLRASAVAVVPIRPPAASLCRVVNHLCRSCAQASALHVRTCTGQVTYAACNTQGPTRNRFPLVSKEKGRVDCQNGAPLALTCVALTSPRHWDITRKVHTMRLQRRNATHGCPFIRSARTRVRPR